MQEIRMRTWNGRKHLMAEIAHGKDELKEYWTNQWQQINPKVDSTNFILRDDGTIEVTVHQFVKDLQDNVLLMGR
jgi:hypothetical protein